MEPRRARGSIDRAKVLDAALAVADRDGFEGVTIRAVARELGMAPMSLYTHFANKEQLHDLMLEEVVVRLSRASGKPTWQQELEAGCRNARGILLEHPSWHPLLKRVTVPRLTLKLWDRLIELMSRDGFSAGAATLAVSSAMSFTLGLVLVERMMAAHGEIPIPVQQLRIAREMLPRLPRGTYPRLRRTASAIDRWSFETIFDVGLRALLAGIELHGAEPRRAARGWPRRTA